MKKIVLIACFFTTIVCISCSKSEDNAVDPKKVILKAGFHFDDFSTGYALDYSNLLFGPNVHNQPNHATPKNLKLVGGKYGNAVSFDDSTSMLVIPYGLGEFPNGFTIDFWLKLKKQSSTAYKNIISETIAGNASTFRIGIKNYFLSFDFINNPEITPALTSTKLDTNTWYHVAITYSGFEEKLYLNGVLNNSNTKLMGGLNSWNSLYVGYRNNFYGNESTFYGILDELRIWNKYYTIEEVNNFLMNSPY